MAIKVNNTTVIDDSRNITTSVGTVDGRNVATDGSKLDGIATGANNYSHPTGNGNNHIPSGGSADQILKYASAGTAVWAVPSTGTTNVTVTSSNSMAYNDDKGALEKYDAGQYLLEYTATSDCLVFVTAGTLKYRYMTVTDNYYGYSYRVYVNGTVVNSKNMFYGAPVSSSTGTVDGFFGGWGSGYLGNGQKLIVTAGEHETQNQGYVQWYDSSMSLAVIPL